jgi:hypothetical protein
VRPSDVRRLMLVSHRQAWPHVTPDFSAAGPHFDLRQNGWPVAAEHKLLALARKINRDGPTSDLSLARGGAGERGAVIKAAHRHVAPVAASSPHFLD